MSKVFTIDFEWLDRYTPDEAERFTFANIKMSVGGVVITELEDVNAKTIRPSARLSAYAMAVWLLGNWWRLVREPERGLSESWEMSHRLGAIGQGFLWPDLSFKSDGSALLVRMNATPPSSRQMVRYLNGVCEFVSVVAYEATVLSFADAVIDRLHTMGCQTSLLQDLRDNIVEERSNPSSVRWREMEALLGYAPDEAPEELMSALLAKGELSGYDAVEEVIAQSITDTPELLDALFRNVKGHTEPMVVPDTEALRVQASGIDSSLLPWERAALAARASRKHWALPDGPVSNRQLMDLFSLSSNIFTDNHRAKSPMTVGFRNGVLDRLDVCLNTSYPTNHRFALLRLVGDRLYCSDADKFLPVTTVKTARQKFQRAYAQEFLCPSDALKDFVGEDFGEEKVDEAAHYFNVSTRLVETTLVNKGYIDRGSLFD